MPSYLDLGLIVVVLISALLSMLRGFTREVLAIASWGAAAFAAYKLYPYVFPYVHPYIAKDTIAQGVSATIVFFVTLLVVTLLTVKLSDSILDSKVGALDRSLGFLFGAARGFLLCVVAFLFFDWLVAEKQKPEWVKTAKSKPYLEYTGDQLKAMLPDDPEGIINRFKKQRAPGDDTPAEPDSSDGKSAAPTPSPGSPAPAPAAPAPAAAPLKKTENAGVPGALAQSDRQALESLVAQPAGAPKKR